MKEEKKLIEAALFISGRALSLAELRMLTGIGAIGYLRKVAEKLRNDYEEINGAIEILEVEGKYIMRVRNDYIERVKQFAQDQEISRGALRILAYVSKRDGCLKSEVAKKMGSHVYPLIKELVEASFIREKKAGRSSKLLLTDKFRKYFGESTPSS